MSPALILWGIRSAIRVGKAASAAYAQRIRDRKILLPDIDYLTHKPLNVVNSFFRSDAGKAYLQANPDLKPSWNSDRGAPVSLAALDVLLAEAMKVKSQSVPGDNESDKEERLEAAGFSLIQQWQDGEGPAGPLGRIVLTLTDVAAEFFATNPGVLKIGASGDQLLEAFAGNLAEAIPDDSDDFGKRGELGGRVVAAFLRAGLETVSENPELVLKKESIQALLKSAVAPLTEALPKTISEQADWRGLLDALLDDSAKAVFGVLAEKPSKYFGEKFETEKALGAFLQVFLQSTHRLGIKDQLTDDGLKALFKASAGLIAERPELILGRSDSDVEKFTEELLRGVANKIQADGLGGGFAVAVVTITLESFRKNAGALLGLGDDMPWEKVALAAVGQVTDGLAAQVEGGKGAFKLFGEAHLVALARVFLEQAAATPGMLGAGRTELKNIISAVAGAMAADEDLLLTSDDWHEIAQVAVTEAAANPGRLFGLDDNAGEAIAAKVIKALLTVAGDQWGDKGRDGKSVLFGPTLKEVVVTTLRIVSGNVAAAVTNVDAIEKLAKDISEEIAAKPDSFGSKEWLALFKALIGRVLVEGEIELSDELITQILGTRAAA